MNWKTLLKLLFTALLLCFLAYELELSALAAVLASARLNFLALAVFLQACASLIAVLRWKMILAYFTVRIRYFETMRIVFMGNFFNLFLPSAIGGDVFRAFYVSRYSKKGLSQMLTTTVLDRSAGLSALLLIGLGGALYADPSVGGVRISRLFLGLMLIYVVLNVALFHGWSHRTASRLLRRFGLHKLEQKLELIYEGLGALIRDPLSVISIIGLSLVIQFLAVCVMWFAAHALRLEANFSIFLIFIPLINLSIMVPITINGFGLRESLYLLLFTELGVARETAVALGLLQAIIVMVVALPGGVLYVMRKKERAESSYPVS